MSERRYALPLWRCAGCSDAEYAAGRPKGWRWMADEKGARVLLCAVCRVRVVGERRKAGKGKRRPGPEPEVRSLPAKPTFKRICPECQEPFETTKPRMRYCAHRCVKRASVRRLKAEAG